MRLELNGMGWTSVRRAAAAIATIVALLLVAAAGAQAAVYTPTTTDDAFANPANCPPDAVETDPSADCSLRDAIEAANATPADDDVALEGKRYELDPSEITLRIRRATGGSGGGKLLVRGTSARATIVDGNSTSELLVRPFTFEPLSDGELRDLAITGGAGRFCGECQDDDEFQGGGVAVQDFDGDGGDARALLTRVRVFDNGVDEDGGGIVNDGKLTITQSLIDHNVAGHSAGGIENDDELTIVNTTISGNEALGDVVTTALSEQSDDSAGNGGGIDNDGDAREEEAPFVRLSNSTVAFNTAEATGGGISTATSDGPGDELTERLSFPEPDAFFHNTIVSDNTGQNATEANCSGNASNSSEGHNLEDGEGCGFTAEGDLNKDAGLAPLADNGGGTDTHKLLDDSAAIDAAEAEGCPEVDQRGTARPQRTACDIGAFEREPAPVEEDEPKGESPPQTQPQPQTPQAQGNRCRDTLPPITTLNRQGLRVDANSVRLSGISRDQGAPCASGVQRVEVSLAKVSGTELNCRFQRRIDRFLIGAFQNCRQPILFVAEGTTRWRFKFNVALPPGKYRAQARGYDEARNKETPKKHRNIVVFTVK